MKKFTTKMDYKNSKEKITQNSKSQYTKISLPRNRDYSQRIIQKIKIQTLLFQETDGRLVFIFLSITLAPLFWLPKNKKKNRSSALARTAALPVILSCFNSLKTKENSLRLLFCLHTRCYNFKRLNTCHYILGLSRLFYPIII